MSFFWFQNAINNYKLNLNQGNPTATTKGTVALRIYIDGAFMLFFLLVMVLFVMEA